MKRIKLYLETGGREGEIDFKLRRMINAGYSARNQEGVRKHIEELKKEGVPAPESTPTAYEIISKLIYFDDEIEVIGNKTSGEAEYVLLCSGKEVYVGVGSDHTDRELESVSIIKSKIVCPNILSNRIWDLRDVREDWDGMILRSWIKDDKGKKVLYQEAPLSAMMTPEDLMTFVKQKLNDQNLDGTVIFSGTIPTLSEKMIFSPYFEVELTNPRNGKRLGFSYKINVLDYLRG